MTESESSELLTDEELLSDLSSDSDSESNSESPELESGSSDVDNSTNFQETDNTKDNDLDDHSHTKSSTKISTKKNDVYDLKVENPKPKAKSKPIPKPIPKTKTKSKPKAKPAPKEKSKAKPNTKPAPKAKSKAKSKPKTKSSLDVERQFEILSFKGGNKNICGEILGGYIKNKKIEKIEGKSPIESVKDFLSVFNENFEESVKAVTENQPKTFRLVFVIKEMNGKHGNKKFTYDVSTKITNGIRNFLVKTKK